MHEDYLKARKLGEKEFRRLSAEKKDPYLKALEDKLPSLSLLNRVYVGTFDIPLNMIAGTYSSSRKLSFASNYMPVMEEGSEFSYKWNRVLERQAEYGIDDPIKVYEYLHKFYVEEGNKRVSVMKYLGNFAIRAEVYRIMPERNEENGLYFEFLDFYKVAPIYEISFSEKGSYRKLAEYAGMDLNNVWPLEKVREVEAAYLRFYNIYMDRGGYKLSITPGDALLKYLAAYSFDSLLDRSRNVLENRVSLMWNEILSNASKQFVLKDPSEKKDSGLLHILNRPSYNESHPLKIAFIHNDGMSSKWVREHEKGIESLRNSFEKIIEKESFFDCDSDMKVEKAVSKAIEDKCEVIFGTSSTLLYGLLRQALIHKDVRFFDCGININSNAVRTYYGRLYEAKFLTGILAAQLTDNHKIACIADAPVFGTLANINAFALGVAAIDPYARVYLLFKGMKDFDYDGFIKDKGIRVLSVSDSLTDEENGKNGVCVINEDGSAISYGTAYFKWGRYYEMMVKPLIEGHEKPFKDDETLFYWWGMSEGVVDISLSDNVSYYSRKTLNDYKKAITEGNYRIFKGELRSQKGLILSEYETLSPEKIISMDWLNDNIIGDIPAKEEMDEGTKALIEVSGVRSEDHK